MFFCLLIDIVLQNLSEKSTHIHKNRNPPKSTDCDVILNIFERKMGSKKLTKKMFFLVSFHKMYI